MNKYLALNLYEIMVKKGIPNAYNAILCAQLHVMLKDN